MPSFITCTDGHVTKSVLIRNAAILLSKKQPIGVCRKCGKELQYRIEHTYANEPNPTPQAFVVTRAVRLGTRMTAEENYDPFLLVLKHLKTGYEEILPTFWANGRSGTQRGGQFPPILSLKEWKTLFDQVEKESGKSE